MLSLVHFARVAEVAVVKRILQDERDLRDMDTLVAAREDAAILKHRGKVVERYGAGGIELEELAHEPRVLLVDADRLGARVVQIAERSETGIDALPCLLPEPARSIRAQLANVLVRHTELHRHHQDIIVGEVGAIVRLDMTNHALLQEPLYLPAVHRIARKTVDLPTNDALRLAFLYPRHHIAEYRTARHLRRALFYEYLNDVESFALCERAKLNELGFDRQHLLVLDIGALAGVKKIFVHKS